MVKTQPHAWLKLSRWFRITLVIASLLWFFWLGIEDPGTITVLILAAVILTPIAIWSFNRYIAPWPRSGARRFAAILILGLLSGIVIAPLAILLMAVKTSLHNHVVPDFTRADVIEVIDSAPAWTLGALLLAAAGALFERVSAK